MRFLKLAVLGQCLCSAGLAGANAERSIADSIHILATTCSDVCGCLGDYENAEEYVWI